MPIIWEEGVEIDMNEMRSPYVRLLYKVEEHAWDHAKPLRHGEPTSRHGLNHSVGRQFGSPTG